MTGLESRPLGAEEYRRRMAEAGLSVVGEYDDEGQNYYFEGVRNADPLRLRSGQALAALGMTRVALTHKADQSEILPPAMQSAGCQDDITWG
jgi:hypothetical protein